MENQNTRPDTPTLECSLCSCVGYAYIPTQRLNETYKPAVALARGTIFPELELSISEYGKICKATGGIM